MALSGLPAISIEELECRDSRGCPDLTSRIGQRVVEWKNFKKRSCAVREGAVKAGTRRLLRFTFVSQNRGIGAIIVGNPNSPNNSDLFTYDDCHRHFHFNQFADYRLWTPAGWDQWNNLRSNTPSSTLSSTLLAAHPELNPLRLEGYKQGFCMLDSSLVPNFTSPDPRTYTSCTFQGIGKGWEDVYGYYLDGQWIDITGVSAGYYYLETEVNAEHFIKESNYGNNRGVVQIYLQ